MAEGSYILDTLHKGACTVDSFFFTYNKQKGGVVVTLIVARSPNKQMVNDGFY